MNYLVETYAPAGSACDPEIATHDDLTDAFEDARKRLGRAILPKPGWHPDADMAPEGHGELIPVGAWHESDRSECGGVAVWSIKTWRDA